MFLMMTALGAFALAACLAVIPILVHLLHRQKVTPIAWGAMQFLLETPLKVRRRRKIDNWLLMLLRIAILAVLALLLARPVVRLNEVRASAPMDVVVVLDHSMTMGTRAGAGGGTLYAHGIDMIERVARMLPASGTMSVILAESTSRIMTPTPVKMGPSELTSDGIARGEWARDINALRQLKPGMSKGDIPRAISAARDLLAHGYNTRKLILVVSDQQRSNWEPNDEGLWRQAEGLPATGAIETAGTAVPVYSVPLQAGASSMANASVRAATVLPAFLGVHRPAQVFATVANTGGTDLSNVPVQLEVDGKPVATQQVPALAAGESITVRFDYYFPDAGSHWVRVKTDLVDALEADNAATAAVNVHPKLPVLVVDGQLTGTAAGNFPQAAFLLAAMQPVDPSVDPVTLIDPTVISAAEFSTPRGVRIDDYPIVVLNDLPRLSRDTVDNLADYARRGNGVFLILGPRSEQTFINDVLAKSTLAPISTRGIVHATKAADSDAPAYASMDVKEPVNPAVELLTQGDRNSLAEVAIRSWWQVTPVAQDMRTVIATTSQGSAAGDPLVLEMEQGKLGGKVIVWTTSVGNLEWNNLPLVPNFVPLVNETLFHLASAQDQGQPRQVDAGKPIVWTGPNNQAIDLVTVLAPDGTSATLQPEIRGTNYFVEDVATQQPGLYEMRFAAPPKAGVTPPAPAYYCVNIDPEELDPAVLSANDLAWFKEHGFLRDVVSGETLAKAMDAGNASYEYWWVLGLLVLVMLVVEVLATAVQARKQAGMTLEDQGLAGAMPPVSNPGGVGVAS